VYPRLVWLSASGAKTDKNLKRRFEALRRDAACSGLSIRRTTLPNLGLGSGLFASGALQSTRSTHDPSSGISPMSTEREGSVTHWIGGLKEGDAQAAQEIWQRYFDALVRLARAKLGGTPRGEADEEDVALSAFHSFCQGAANGRFPRLDDRYGLWRLLVMITMRKALDQSQRHRRKKRGGGRVRGESALAGGDPNEREAGLEQIMGRDPTPAFAAMVADECRRLLGALGDENLRRIALLRMEGYSDPEIAATLGCGLRTVGRKLDLIRKTWLREVPP
jgi:DNA-directed RNA polymerase specialized sigma24 family protein